MRVDVPVLESLVLAASRSRVPESSASHVRGYVGRGAGERDEALERAVGA